MYDGNAPANISVVVGTSDGHQREKHQLYVQGQLVLVSARAERITRAVVRAISDLTMQQPDGTLAVRSAVVLDADGRAFLVDRQLANELWTLDRRLRRAGWRVVDTAQASVDVTEGSVILSCPADLLADTLTAADEDHPDRSEGLDDLRGGPHPIAGVVFMGTADGGSLADTLAEAAPMVWQCDYSLRVADVDGLLELLQRVEPVGVRPGDPAALLLALEQLER